MARVWLDGIKGTVFDTGLDQRPVPLIKSCRKRKRGPVSLCTHGTSLELTGLLHTPPPTTVHLLQLFLCQLLILLLAVLFILLHNRINFKLLNLLLINVSGMSLFPFDIAKVRQLSEQNKLFADFRLNYMRHGSAFATIC